MSGQDLGTMREQELDVRLSQDVYLVGGGSTRAFGLSFDPDCHIYVIDGGSELALVDCGMGDPQSLERIVKNIQDEGLDIDRLSTLILTHYHVDHAGGAARFRERLGLKTIAPRGAAQALRMGDERAVSLDEAKRAGLYPADYSVEPVEVDQEVAEGDVLHIGDVHLEVFDTPGHCAGHASYLLSGRERRYLLAGDAVFHGGTIVLQNIHDCSIQESASSARKLADLEFDALLPGHANITLTNGRSHAEMAAATFEQLYVPKNLF